MDEQIARHEIGRLEAQIEKLNDQIAWCSKISLAAKIVIAGGALWFALALIGPLQFDVTTFVGTIAAVLGGVVLLGSNETTWNEATASLRETEVARAALIGQISLRVVGDESVRTLH